MTTVIEKAETKTTVLRIKRKRSQEPLVKTLLISSIFKEGNKKPKVENSVVFTLFDSVKNNFFVEEFQENAETLAKGAGGISSGEPENHANKQQSHDTKRSAPSAERQSLKNHVLSQAERQSLKNHVLSHSSESIQDKKMLLSGKRLQEAKNTRYRIREEKRKIQMQGQTVTLVDVEREVDVGDMDPITASLESMVHEYLHLQEQSKPFAPDEDAYVYDLYAYNENLPVKEAINAGQVGTL